MRRGLSILAFLLAAGASALYARQTAALSIVSSGPAGEMRQLQDANEIRVVFSDPMVALGRVPSNPAPPWIHIAPAIAGAYRWSGTTTLIFTPDPATPLPYSTRYAVTIDAGAASASGKTLPSPYGFAFTTPTAQLISARWYRRTDRFDQAAIIVLEFNQPVRPADVQAHAAVRFEPYTFQTPVLASDARARLAASDPAGPQRFDTKVAAARATAQRDDAVSVHVTTDWDRKRFPVFGPKRDVLPSEDRQVALETDAVPPPGSHLRVTIDTRLPGLQGTATPAQPQQSIVSLDPVFFAGVTCAQACNPSGYNAIHFTRQVAIGEFRRLTVRDLTDPAREQVLTPSAAPASSRFDRSVGFNAEDAGFTRQPPAHTWAYQLPASLQALDGQTLDYPWIAIVENWHERPFTSFGDGHGVWETGGGPLPFSARNYLDVTQWIAPLSAADLVPRIIALQEHDFEDLPPGSGTPRRLNVTPDAIQSYGLDLRALLSPAGTGLFWAGLKQGTPIEKSEAVDFKPKSTLIQVTNLGISVKDSPDSTLVFVTRLDNGEAVPDAAITIIGRDNAAAWHGATDRDGVAMAPALPLRKPDRSWEEFSFVVTAEKNGDLAYVASDWNEGLDSWEFGIPYDLWQSTGVLRGSVFTDRGVYKPGEEVHIKAIVRSDTAKGMLLLPAGSTMNVRVLDSRGKECDHRAVTINNWSSAEWTWTVPATGALGNYSVEASTAPTAPEGNDATLRESHGEWLKKINGAFLVAAYRKPDFRVDATVATDRPIAGADLRATVDARYLFGNALSRRPVTWSLTRQPNLNVPAPILDKFPADKYAFGYYPDVDRADARVAGAVASLDAGGKFAVTVPSGRGADFAYQYTFEGDVEDVSRQHLANRASVVVHPAPWYIGLRRPAFFADVATGTEVDVVAADLAGAIVPGVSVKLTLVHVQWNSVQHAEGGGFYAWTSERIETPAGEWPVTTAAAPVNVKIPVPEGGSYILRAVATDAEGRSTRTEASFYGLGKGYTAWERYDHNRIKLEPEKKTWKPGETARLMIQSPWETATALMTVEREGIRHYERFTLTSTQQTVTVPITEADIPNIYVSVLLIRGRTSNDFGRDGSDPGKPAFRLGYAELTVEDGTKKLGVKVSADHAEYRPANTAKVSVAVTDAANKPAAGEVTLWAVDYGVLSLTGYQMPDVLNAVYQRKALEIMNEDSRQRIISRRVLTPKGANEGGGGGEGPTNARKDFRPLAFWIGSVETDALGRATKEVTLPEALTTYRVMAVAADRTSRFGTASAEIKVNKPVTLLAAFPRFMGLGDTASFGAVVSNTLKTGGEAIVTIKSLSPGLLDFGAATAQTIRLGPGGNEPVRFDATARGIGAARVRMTVKLGAQTDAFETTLPVSAPNPLETSAAFGDTAAGPVSQKITLPAGVVPGLGGLRVDLASTALVGLGEGARYLADYSYDSAEQKASSGLALALAADLGGAFQMGRIAPADYRAKATSLLAELPHFQCADGGFGYWPGNCRYGSAYLTAYILHVMQVSKAAGVAVPDEVVKRALDFLDETVRGLEPGEVQWQRLWISSNAFAVKVLAEYGRNEDSNVTRLVGMEDRVSIFGLSYLADAMAASKARGARYDEVVRRLGNALRIEGDQAHVEEIDEDSMFWIWNSNVRSTALVLDGFVRRGDRADFVPRLVRWLLAARKNGRWDNTQENATALEALVDYYKAFESEVPDMTASVTLGSSPLGTAAFHGRSSTAQQLTLPMPELARQVATGAERDLVVSRAGTGHVYYTARMQFALADPLPALDQGMRVERRYERYAETGGDGPAATTFNAGDLIRVTLTVTLPKERRYVAVADALPAGVEAVDGWFRTTAADLAKDASTTPDSGSWLDQFRHGGFDHVEKYDDRVALFATRLSEGRHEFSYLVRATTAGTFRVAGTRAEEMYAPEVTGRSAPATVVIK